MAETKGRPEERKREEEEKRKTIQECDAYVSWPMARKLLPFKLAVNISTIKTD